MVATNMNCVFVNICLDRAGVDYDIGVFLTRNQAKVI